VKKRDAATFALKARREIAQELRALEVLSMPRSSALLNYLTVLEAESVKAAVSSPGSTVATFGAHRQAVESSTHAIPAIFEQCPQDRVLPIPTVIREVFNPAYELFAFTHNYDQVDYSFRLADRGQMGNLGGPEGAAYNFLIRFAEGRSGGHPTAHHTPKNGTESPEELTEDLISLVRAYLK